MENQGSKLIATNLVKLRYARKEFNAAVEAAERQGEFPEAVRAETEDLLEATPALERAAATKQDKLESKEKTERIDMQQRPRMKFSIFSGRPKDFDIFLKKTERLFHLYPGGEQRVLQMAELVSADIKPHILRYLNAGDSGPAQAAQAMKS